MRKQLGVISFITIAMSLVLCSYREGPAASHGWDCTGAETGLSNPAGCRGNGCHASAATPAIVVTLEMDSAGLPVTHFVAGKSYTIKLTGVNTSTTTLPAFGYQVSCIQGAVAQVTPVNAGTWGTPPAVSQFSGPQSGNFVLNIIEHDNTTPATTGAGDSGTTYVRVIPWTAPAAGMDTVSFWAALNAVNENGQADAGDHWNTKHFVVTAEDSIVVIPNGILPVNAGNGIKVYPNPVIDVLNLQFDNVQNSEYTITVYNISGQMVAMQKLGVSAASNNTNLSTAGWDPGIYIVNLQSGSSQQVFKVVKQ